MRKGREEHGWKVQTWAQVQAQLAPPAPVLETPPSQEEIMKRVEEVEQLGHAGRSLESSPAQQLAQMAVEAGPSTLGGEEPAHKKP